jgi:hypothetical protein
MVYASSEVRKFLDNNGYMVPMDRVYYTIKLADIPARVRINTTDLTKVQCLINRNDLLNASQPVLRFINDYACVQNDKDPFILDGNPYLIYKDVIVHTTDEVRRFIATYGYMVAMSTLKMKEVVKSAVSDTKSLNSNARNETTSPPTAPPAKEIPWGKVGLGAGVLAVISVIVFVE